VYDKKVRRRRIVLFALVGLCLILVTVSFGGGLGSIQRGALEVFAPVQEGANRALKPARDLVGWFDDTFDARGERDRLEKENARLRKEVVAADAALRENATLRKMVRLDEGGLSAYEPVTARVIATSPNLWYSTITIDKGSSAGVKVDQAVVTGDGLVGRISKVAAGASQVTLITDHTSGVSARIARTGIYGVVTAAEVGRPGQLVLDYIPRGAKVRKGERIVTSGSKSSKLESLFPPDIPIGTVSKVDADELELYQRVQVEPFADMRRLEFVQVLTQRPSGARAQLQP
jgi:rod shape-determining protein MreC